MHVHLHYILYALLTFALCITIREFRLHIKCFMCICIICYYGLQYVCIIYYMLYVHSYYILQYMHLHYALL